MDATLTESEGIESPPAIRRRNPWIAAVLAYLSPGLGHVYAGRARRGLAVATGCLVVGVGAFWLSMVARHPALRLGALALAFGVILFAIADAYTTTARTPEHFAPKWYNRWYVYVGLSLATALVVQPVVSHLLRTQVGRAFKIPNTAMEPTLTPGDFLMAAPLGDGPVRRGMVVVFEDASSGISRVSRVEALPGDTVEMGRKTLYVNGRVQRGAHVQHIDPLNDPRDEQMEWQTRFLASPREGYRPSRDTWGPLVVPPGQYLLLGDNRDNSLDSRYEGFVPRERITSRPAWIYFSRTPLTGPTRWSRIGRGID